MSKAFHPDLPLEDRRRLLADNCDSREQTTYYKDLTPEDLDIKRESFTGVAEELFKLQEKIDEIKEEYKARMKPLKEQYKDLLHQISTRKEEMQGVLYSIADHENSIMEVFDDQAEFVSSRRLRPDEKQGKLFIAGNGKVANGE